MSDAPFMVTSTGLILDYNFGSPGSFIATQLLPGATIQLRGGGEFDLTGQLGTGARGALQVDLVTGTAGTVQGVAFVVGNVNATTRYLGVALDASNRPTFAITDNTGSVKVSGTPTGAAIPSGVPLQLQLFWDASLGAVIFNIGGVAQTFTPASGLWAPFAPTAILYGPMAQGFGTPYLVFGGKLNKVQAGNVSGFVLPTVTYGPLNENLTLSGASTMTVASSKMVGHAQATIAGAATVHAVRS